MAASDSSWGCWCGHRCNGEGRDAAGNVVKIEAETWRHLRSHGMTAFFFTDVGEGNPRVNHIYDGKYYEMNSE